MRALRLVVVAALMAAALTAVLPAMAPAVEVGQKAPDFTGTRTKEIRGFDAALPQFEAAGAQVVGVSADHAATLEAFSKQQNLHHLLLSDFRRQMLPAYGALETNEASPIYRYAKRAYFVIDREGVVRYAKIQTNPLDLLDPQEVLKALKESGAK